MFTPIWAAAIAVTPCTVTTGGVTLYWLESFSSSASPITSAFTLSVRSFPCKALVADLVILRLIVKTTSVLGVPTKVKTGALIGLPVTSATEVAFAPTAADPATYSIPVGKVTVTLAVVLPIGNFILIVRVPISKLVLLANCT